jgi:hypothetical protein
LLPWQSLFVAAQEDNMNITTAPTRKQRNNFFITQFFRVQ